MSNKNLLSVKFIVLLALFLAGAFTPVRKAYSCYYCCTGGGQCCSDICECISDAHDELNEDLIPPYENHREYWIERVFIDNFLPSMMKMTEQMVVMAIHQLEILGELLDAKQQLETQHVLRGLYADLHKTYRPSVGICKIGSSMKSLTASDARSDWSKLVLSHRSIQRQLGVRYSPAENGIFRNRESRLEYFRTTYCDQRDLNRGLLNFCSPTTSSDRWNKDIDYSRSVAQPLTLDIDFHDNTGGATADEADVFELHSYLYSNDVFVRIPAWYFKAESGNINPIQMLYMEVRSIVAKRSVAENSYVHNVALRVQGEGIAATYLQALMKEIGIPDAEITEMISDNPSYYAQMKVLMEYANQNPQLYIDLYDTPANVKRKRVALQALGILQKWDILESLWRTEMLAAVAASVRLDEEQAAVQNNLNDMDGKSDGG